MAQVGAAAGGGGGGIGRIEEQLKVDILAIPENTRFNLKLQININGTIIHTSFFVLKDKYAGKENQIRIRNNCIQIYLRESDIDTADSTVISANSPEKKCFTPILNKYTLPPGITTTDVLQIIKTKLLLLISEDRNINLVDIARLQEIYFITVMRLIRGDKKPLYEKYGYKSIFSASGRSYVDILFDAITKTKFGEIKDIPYGLYKETTVGNIITTIIGSKPPDETPITEVFKHIPIETEIQYIGGRPEYQYQLSEIIFTTIAIKNGFKLGKNRETDKYSNTLKFSLNQGSPEWNKWTNIIKIINFDLEPIDPITPPYSPATLPYYPGTFISALSGVPPINQLGGSLKSKSKRNKKSKRKNKKTRRG